MALCNRELLARNDDDDIGRNFRGGGSTGHVVTKR